MYQTLREWWILSPNQNTEIPFTTLYAFSLVPIPRQSLACARLRSNTGRFEAVEDFIVVKLDAQQLLANKINTAVSAPK